MKKFIATTFLLTALASAPVHAADTTIAPDVTIKVNGLVCDFCAQAINKVFRKQEAVNDVEVNLDDGLITVDLKDGQDIDDETLTGMVTDAGYNVTEITRDAQ